MSGHDREGGGEGGGGAGGGGGDDTKMGGRWSEKGGGALGGWVGEGRRLAAESLESGRALEKFRQIVRRQGGDAAALDDFSRLPQAAHRRDVASPAGGVVAEINCEKVGLASVLLGAGREKKEDAVDPAVGLIVHKKLGDAVREGEPLVTLHYNAAAQADLAAALVGESYRIAASAPAMKPLVRRVIGP